MKRYKEIFTYLFFGICTTIVNLLTYYLLTCTILDSNNMLHIEIATVISWITCVTFAYFTNKKYVFKSTNKSNFKEALKFYLSRIFTLIIEGILMFIFVSKLEFNDKLIKPIIQIIIIILNYLFSKIFVFKK